MDEKQVLEAIAQLEATGEAITTRAVLALTKGSKRDVVYYVREWREGRLLPQSDWSRLEDQIDDLRGRIDADRTLRRQYTHTKELVGLLLTAVRRLADHPPAAEVHHTPSVRPMTRRERSDYNKAQWGEVRTLQRLLRSRFGY